MLYVIYCPQMDEKEIIQSCKEKFNAELLRDAFVFTYDCMRKYEGEWHTETAILFPHYVFLESDCPEKLIAEFKCYEYLNNNIQPQQKGYLLIPVKIQEENFLRRLSDDMHHIGMSVGEIVDGKTCVLAGPLVGKESYIRKINRHKRLALLEYPCGEQIKKMNVGLEIIEKS